jgi:anti-anti-sigma factor
MYGYILAVFQQRGRSIESEPGVARSDRTLEVDVPGCDQLLGIATYCWPNGRHVLRLVGDLDTANAHRLFDAVVDLDLRPGQSVTMNLEDVTFLDSVGASVLLACQTVVDEHACAFTITSSSLQARAVLELMGLDRLLHDDDRLETLPRIQMAP